MPKGLTLRKVQRAGNSLAVTLPPSAVRVLRARAGRPVQVVARRGGTVTIAPVSRRVGVHREYEDLVERNRRLEAEVTRWKGKYRQRPLRIYNEGFAQGTMQAHTRRFYDVDRLLDWVRALCLVAAADFDLPPDPSNGGTPP